MRAHIRIVTLMLLVAPVVVPGLTVATANAHTIYVCWDGSGDYLTIQEGIDAARHGDEVVVCDGVYTGAANKNLDFGGKPITVRSANGPDNCIIDCENDGRGFYFHNSETASSVLDGFTITNGKPGLPIVGGGVYCNHSSPTIINCRITGNNMGEGSGGGVCCLHSRPTITKCTITGNTADNGAGVVLDWSDATITNCHITGNAATDRGGGIYCVGNTTTISNCTISGNTAHAGGGIYCVWRCSVTIQNTILWGDASPLGPEIAMFLAYDVGGTVSVSYSDVEGGEGAAYVEDGCELIWGNGNIDADPLFVDPDGPDDDPNTWEDNDFHLSGGSPCIDAADNYAVLPDVTTDLDGNPRFVDDPYTEDTGNGVPPIVDMGAYEFQAGAAAFLDIKPGSCPNPLNRNSQGVLPVALVGTEDFDVTQVDLDSLELTRADGIGGSVTPLMGPPGPGIRVEDVATPFDGEPCECHELGGDGIADLAMKFDTPEMVAVLELEDLSGGASVELVLSGELLDTAHFSATDCVILVPPGPGPGALPAQSGPEDNGIDAVPEPAPAARPDNPDAAQNDGTAGELSPQPVGCGVLPPGFLLTAAAGMYLINRARPSAGRPE